jgi:hypothetical protein
VGNREGKRQRKRARLLWVDIIKMDLGQIGWGGMVLWYGQAQIRDQRRAQ